MPTCPRCHVAYLDSERHACQPSPPLVPRRQVPFFLYLTYVIGLVLIVVLTGQPGDALQRFVFFFLAGLPWSLATSIIPTRDDQVMEAFCALGIAANFALLAYFGWQRPGPSRRS